MRSEALAETLHCFVSARCDPGRPAAAGALGDLSFGVKDLIDVAGEPTGAGCATPRIDRAAQSAVVVDRLLDAGAAYAGKTHTVQLAFGGWGTNVCTGAPRNPWDDREVRIAGGSSSGSAVAVAAGLVDFALGTDTGGSIRIPASLCGVVGLKPSWGVVSTQGVLALAPSLDSVGPLGADVGTVARAFAVMADRPTVARAPSLASLTFRSLGPADLEAEDDVLSAYAGAVARIRAAGGRMEDGPLPVPPADYVQPTGRILGYEAWASHGDYVRSGARLDPGVRRRFLDGASITPSDYGSALDRRREDQAIFARWFDGADILVTPTTARTAARLDEVDEADGVLGRYTRIANYLDLCGLTLPCGLDRSGLPIGLQLLGRARAEDLLLAAGLALEPLLIDAPIAPPFHLDAARSAAPPAPQAKARAR